VNISFLLSVGLSNINDMNLTKLVKRSLPGTFLLMSLMVNGQQGKPNIVFILADDLGWSDLPVYGNKFNEAPNLGKLAKEGMRFTNAYSASPVCSPTRASIMSGQYPARVGIIDWIPGHWRPYEEVVVPSNQTQYLPGEIETIGEALKKTGYKTGYFGKWHLGEGTKYHPLSQGYEEANVGQGYYKTKFDPPREQSSDKIISERLADFGIDFIEKHKKEPFFLFIANWDVHCMLDSDPALINKYQKKERVDGYPCNAVYAAMIEQMDRSHGRLLDKLKSCGLDENTIVIFTSDNGGIISENQYPGVEEDRMQMLIPDKRHIYKDSPLQYIATTNVTLRSEKGSLYEGGIRVPLLVRWPAKVKAGTQSKAIISSVDFYTTFLELAGAGKPEPQTLDGVSFLPALVNGKFDKDRAIFWHYPVYHHDVPGSAVRKGDWKLIENLVDGSVKLYNLSIDNSESTDLSRVFPKKTTELFSLLKEWQKEVKAEFPKPNPNFDKKRRDEWAKHP